MRLYLKRKLIIIFILCNSATIHPQQSSLPVPARYGIYDVAPNALYALAISNDNRPAVDILISPSTTSGNSSEDSQ
jgi:hypothetical protein